MARIRPTEHKAVVQLLDAPAVSVEQLAIDVIVAIDDLRAKRTDWFVIVVDPGVCVHLHGPFLTKNAAQKGIENKEVFAASNGAKGLIVQLHMSDDEGVEIV